MALDPTRHEIIHEGRTYAVVSLNWIKSRLNAILAGRITPLSLTVDDRDADEAAFVLFLNDLGADISRVDDPSYTYFIDDAPDGVLLSLQLEAALARGGSSSSTTMLVGGALALGALWFLMRRR